MAGAANRFNVLAKFLKPTAYYNLPSDERPKDLTSESSRLEFWAKIFDTDNSMMYLDSATKNKKSAKVNLDAFRVVQLDPVNYRFFVRISEIGSRGEYSNSSRAIKGSAANNGLWWFDIKLPSLLEYVLLTYRHKSSDGSLVGFTDQAFDGAVHTNDAFNFAAGSTAKFYGKATSVGCQSIPTTPSLTYTCPNIKPKVYIDWNTKYKTSSAATDDKINSDLKKYISSKVQFNKGYDFTADFKAFPINANDQQAAALGLKNMGSTEKLDDGSIGLTLDSGAAINMYVGDANRNEVSGYTGSKWTEPNPVYQYIDIQTESVRFGSGNSVSKPLIRIDQNGVIQYTTNKTSPSWISLSPKFNGMIFGDGIDGISSITGGKSPRQYSGASGKSNPEISTIKPAFASFSKITIAAINTIKIESDLVASDTPCSFSDFGQTTKVESCRKKINIAGIYSQKGKVTIGDSAPHDIHIHATLMSSESEVNVNKYNSYDRGTVNITGGVIEYLYGIFGQGSNGYSRDFTYDQRLKEGNVPPYFPVSPIWKASDASKTGNSLDNIIWKQVSAGEF